MIRLNGKVSDSAPRTERTPKVTALISEPQQCASIMYVVAVFFCFSVHVKGRCSGDRGPTFASVPPAEDSAKCPLSSAV